MYVVVYLGRQVTALRALRVIRLGRITRMHDGLKVVMEALLKIMPAMGTIIIPYGIFVVTFSIIGLNIFGGYLWQCNDTSVCGRADCIGMYNPNNSTNLNDTSSLIPRWWLPYRFYYDNFYQSALDVIVISFQEGWPDDMHRNMDIVDVDLQPRRDFSEGLAVFNCITLFFGNWFFLSVLEAVIIDALGRKQEEVEGLQLLSENQKKWMKTLKQLLVARPKFIPPIPTSNIRKYFHEIATHPKFEMAILAVVMVNVFVMATHYEDEPYQLEMFHEVMEVIFTLIYLLEALILVLGIGFRGYFSDNWNIFSLVIVVFACCSVGIRAFGHGVYFALRANVFSPLRIFRLIRLVKVVPGIHALIRSVAFTLSQLINVMLLMVLGYIVFGIVGMFFFGKINSVATDNFTDHINFTDFPTSMLLCYVMMTGS